MRPRFSPARHRALRVPRLGLLLRRNPRLWWLTVGACALAVGGAVSHAFARADEARAGWGAVRSVLVTTRDVDAGEVLGPGDVELVARPRSMVPRSALRSLPRSATASAAMLTGEIVVADRLAERSLSEVAARIPAGERAIAIPVDASATPPLSVGDRVDVLVAIADVEGEAGSGPLGFVVAAGALVIAVDEMAVTVAVDRHAAPKVATALGQGAVTLALVGG